MKKLLISLFTGALAVGIGTAAAAPDCDKSAEKLEAAIKEDPEKVLLLLTSSLSKNEECACELVKVAIEASEADVPMVRQIVTAAVLVEGVEAATVAECATAAMPDAAKEIKAALQEVFEGADEVIVVDEDDTDDFGPYNRVVSGVYMIPPIAGGSVDPAADAIRERIRDRIIRVIEVITTPKPQSP